MRHIATVLAVIAVLLVLQSGLALPNSSTSVSGQNCLMGHNLRYSYTVNAPKEVTVGDTFTVTLGFSASMDSNLRRAPMKVSATLSGTNVELVGNMMQQCAMNKATTWQLTATKPGTAILEFATSFYLNGNEPVHRGYSATYKDTVDFTITVKDKPAAEPPAPVKNTTQESSGNSASAEQPAGTTPPKNQTATLAENQTATIVTSGMQNNQTIVREFDATLTPEPDETSWYITRFLGLLAYLLLFLSMLTALLKRSNYAPRLTKLFKYHQDVSIMALLISLFHGLSNVFDGYMWNMSLYDVFFPRFGTQTQLFLSTGIICFYVMLLVTVTSYRGTLMKRIGFKRWKYIHMSSYIGFIVVFAHSVLLGTDLQQGPFPYAFWASGLIIFLISVDLLIKRMLTKRFTLNKKLGVQRI